ncbi:MAG: hypothetical protein U5N56_00505 [Candidatus Marinimicrobia bacterium]|nr:hypothetical protein [Candidatus Neomarinimicrobiota bacterium]
MHRNCYALLLLLLMLVPVMAENKGTVYLVPGSDTSIWDGLNTNIYDGRLFNAALYTDPGENGYAVMDTAFRYPLRDSFGTPMKMTWWMMAGNVFHRSVNCNIPVRTNITLYLMKKYHAQALERYDDRLSLHYHTYYWSDPQNDGVYRYEMAPDFDLNRDDYERTLCTFLIEDDVFPVSFRSGWMYMDENWQDYQERFIPFDMSDYWTDYSNGSQPFHPSAENYREKGDMKQWRVRSIYFTVLDHMSNALKTVFREASEGEDQMLCMWSHLPETCFSSGMDTMNTLAHELSETYDVDFKYCRDTEAMRLWIAPEDTVAPVLSMTEIREGDNIRFVLTSDGPVFQTAEPFVALKTMYGTYERLACEQTGEYQWETVKALPTADVAKVAATVCDSVGNQSNAHLHFVPDDIYIDDKDPAYTGERRYLDGSRGRAVVGPACAGAERTGIPHAYTGYSGDPNTHSFARSGQYHGLLRCIVENSLMSDTLELDHSEGINAWQFIGFYDLEAGTGNSFTIENLKDNKALGFDVLLITPLVTDKYFTVSHELLTFSEVCVTDSVTLAFTMGNRGSEDLTVSSLSHFGDMIEIHEEFPLVLAPMEERVITVSFSTQQFCEYNDVIVINTDDPRNPRVLLPVYASALTYYQLVDNEDPLHYNESGEWHTSVAQASGGSSRYTGISGNGDHADFTLSLDYSGVYDIQFIVPTTSNAHDHAHYIVMIDGYPQDTLVVNQNSGSGTFVSLGEFDLPADVPVTMRIQDNGGNTNHGAVLRADAVKFILRNEKFVSAVNNAGIPGTFRVFPNYPNPFNPSTQIYFALPQSGEVRIDFFDIRGRKVDRQIRKTFEAGYHRINVESGRSFGRRVPVPRTEPLGFTNT